MQSDRRIMEISSISTIVAPTPTAGLSATSHQTKQAIASSSTSDPQSSPVATFNSSASADASPAAPLTASASSSASSKSVETSSSSARIQSSAGISDVATVEASYSITVGGKNYSGSVEESGGTYIASVPNPPGASAVGSSVQSAEENLNIKLDSLA